MGLNIEFDEYTVKLFAKLLTAESSWQHYMNEFATQMGQDAREYMKPFVQAKSKWAGSTHGTGAMADSIKEDITMLGNGFGITFDGNFYGNYLDVGNFPADSEIARTSGKPFPVGARAGQSSEDITYSTYIHGIGHYNPADWPAHFSEKTAKWLATETNMQKYCDEFIGRFLEELILP
jgi:hypothetical protein